MLSSQLQLL